MRHRGLQSLLVVGVLGAGALGAPPAGAAPGTAGHAVPVRLLVGGLDNPRGLEMTRDGLLLAQAGRGGTSEDCVPNPEDPETPSCLGATGKISHVTADGHVHDLVTGLPSLAAPGGARAIGPSDVSAAGPRRVFATVGLAADPADEEVQEGVLTADPRLASLVRLRDGKVRRAADLGLHEAEQNPDGGVPDTNPNSVVATRTERVVADAGANALLRVRRGEVQTLAVFPDRMVDAPPFLGLPPGTQIPMQAVPNSVVRGPDGAYYVGQLTGFPFPVGGANVYRVVPGEEPTVYASGFTNIIDLAFLPDGQLMVLEIRHQSLLSPDREGGLLAVPTGGGEAHLVMTDPLVEPGGLAVHGRTAYVSNRSTEAGTGEVLQLELPAG